MFKSPSFLIEGEQKLEGEIRVQGGKNAALCLIAATLLTKEECRLENVPDIEDIRLMLSILEGMGAKVGRDGNFVVIENKDIDPSKFNKDKARKIRASILFLGPLLARFSELSLSYPGGDKIGRRSIDTHLDAFEDIGCVIDRGDDKFSIKCVSECDLPEEIVLNDFSVTATENMLMFAAFHNKRVKLYTAAEEPSVQNLQEFLNKMGAALSVLPYHGLIIQGSDSLTSANIQVRPDYIEAGTFVAMALAVGEDVKITNFPINDLKLLIHLLKRRGANIKQEGNDTLIARRSLDIKLGRIQTMIYPGFPTDLQSPFGVLATQTQGTTLIHDPLFEGRLKYLTQLKQMGARIRVIDDHRAEIYGPVKLKGTVLEGKDIRGAMSFIIAGMAAEGKTIINNAYQVDRGYEKIEKRLVGIGAKVKRV